MGLSIGNQLLGSTGLSVGLGLSRGNGLYFGGFGGGAPFTPAVLFAAGEQGVWYDPSDMATLFQDSTGFTPVTAVEDPVGLMLDLSKSGVGTNGAKRVNLLTWTQAFDDAAWTKSNSTATNTADTTDPLGGSTAEFLKEDSANAIHFISQNATYVSGSGYIHSLYAKRAVGGSVRYLQLVLTSTSGAFSSAYANFDLTGSGSVTGFNGVSASVSSVGNGWYHCSVSATAAASVTAAFAIVLQDSPTAARVASYTGDNTSGLYIWGADLRLASEASTVPTPYQRIDASWSATMPGNHATQATPSARPVLSARVNLLTKTEQFDDAVWQKTAITITANDTTAPDGTTTADKFVESNTSTSGTLLATSATIALTNQRIVVSVKPSNTTWHIIGVFNNAVSEYVLVWFNVSTGVVGTSSTVGTAFSLVALSPSITAQANGFYQLGFTVSTTVTQAKIFSCSATANGGLTRVTSGTYWLWGADLRVANDTALPVYQRVDTSTSYDTTGFPMYLRFDGSDDAMETASINFTSTDKMSVFAGVRKLSDAARGVLAELSTVATNPGTFLLDAPPSAIAGYGVFLNGTGGGGFYAPVTYAAPITNTLTALLDIGAASLADEIKPRINGVLDQDGGGGTVGTGNFGNYPLYIGSRAGTSLRFNGRLYSLIVRGAATSDTLIGQTENWISGEMGGGYYPTGFDFLVDANGDQITDANGNPIITQAYY
jgi:hypothetical protein